MNAFNTPLLNAFRQLHFAGCPFRLRKTVSCRPHSATPPGMRYRLALRTRRRPMNRNSADAAIVIRKAGTGESNASRE